MHSRQKVEEFGLNQTMVQTLYGSFMEIAGFRRDTLIEMVYNGVSTKFSPYNVRGIFS